VCYCVVVSLPLDKVHEEVAIDEEVRLADMLREYGRVLQLGTIAKSWSFKINFDATFVLRLCQDIRF